MLSSLWYMYHQRHFHFDAIKWKHFPRYWSFVRAIHRSPVSSSHSGQWHGALMLSLTCAWLHSCRWGWWFKTLSRSFWRHCNVLQVARHEITFVDLWSACGCLAFIEYNCQHNGMKDMACKILKKPLVISRPEWNRRRFVGDIFNTIFGNDSVLNQCWPRYMMLYGVTLSQWCNKPWEFLYVVLTWWCR